MLHKTQYTLRQHGEDIIVNVSYLHVEACNSNYGEHLQIIATSPHLDFSAEAREELDLHCWTDLAMKQTNELIAENMIGSPLTNPDQEIPPCRMH